MNPTENKETIRKTIELLREYELTDEEAQRLADYDQPSLGGLHAWGVSVVSIEETDDGDYEVDIGDPVTFEGNQHPRWDSNVVGTFGVGPSTPEGIRQSFNTSAGEMIRELRRHMELIDQFPPREGGEW